MLQKVFSFSFEIASSKKEYKNESKTIEKATSNKPKSAFISNSTKNSEAVISIAESQANKQIADIIVQKWERCTNCNEERLTVNVRDLRDRRKGCFCPKNKEVNLSNDP